MFTYLHLKDEYRSQDSDEPNLTESNLTPDQTYILSKSDLNKFWICCLEDSTVLSESLEWGAGCNVPRLISQSLQELVLKLKVLKNPLILCEPKFLPAVTCTFKCSYRCIHQAETVASRSLMSFTNGAKTKCWPKYLNNFSLQSNTSFMW